jgi:hypothetical protein
MTEECFVDISRECFPLGRVNYSREKIEKYANEAGLIFVEGLSEGEETLVYTNKEKSGIYAFNKIGYGDDRFDYKLRVFRKVDGAKRE